MALNCFRSIFNCVSLKSYCIEIARRHRLDKILNWLANRGAKLLGKEERTRIISINEACST